MDNQAGLIQIGAMARSSPSRWRSGWTIQRYILLLTAKPFFGTLLVVVPALLLERLLRLFDLIAQNSVPADSVVRMLLDLVPHYLGQALPVALFVGIHAVVSRLNASNELDAMQNAGLSLAWISRPFIFIGLLAALGGFGLYGYLEPLSRYAYRVGLEVATQGGWNAILLAGQITPISANLVVEADGSQADGRLRRVFIYQRRPDGSELASTGRGGQLELVAGPKLVLRIDRGAQLQVDPDGSITTLTAADTITQRPYVLPLVAYPARGLDEREMTLGELWAARNSRHPPQPRRRLDGALHSRVILALSYLVIPFLAVPFGLAAKRTSHAYGIVIGVLILILYLHAVQLAAALGTANLIDPRFLLWAVFVLFSVFCLLIFRRANRRSSEGPLDALFASIETAVTRIRRRWRHAGGRTRPAA